MWRCGCGGGGGSKKASRRVAPALEPTVMVVPADDNRACFLCLEEVAATAALTPPPPACRFRCCRESWRHRVHAHCAEAMLAAAIHRCPVCQADARAAYAGPDWVARPAPAGSAHQTILVVPAARPGGRG